MLFILKTLVSGLLVAGASALARRHPGPAGLLIALPTTTLLTLLWMSLEGVSKTDAAIFLQTVGWVTLAGMGLFFITPFLIRMGWGLGPAFAVGIAALAIGSWIATRLGAY